MLVVRPAKLTDLNALIGLARLAGPGFTSLAVSDEELKIRLEKSLKSFAMPEDKLGNFPYLLMLEDSESGEVVGLSAVKAQVGTQKPFYSFKLLNIIQSSNVAKRHFDMEVMLLVNEYTGASEVGTLFIKPKMRGTRAGRLISQARYMLIATAPDRFAKTVISELRGCVGADGYSPFWEGLGRRFFQMDFSEADKITAETDNQFIADLMPKYPIYKALLSDEAQDVIGKPHPDGVAAKKLLEAEGFRYDKFIDIFDAGPTMAVPRDQIRTIKESRLMTVAKNNANGHMFHGLVSNHQVKNFRTVYADMHITDQQVGVSDAVLQALEIKSGDTVRILAHPKLN